jgi:hypothetical protein
MLRLFLAQRLLGLVMTVVIGAAAWFLFGKDILNDLREDVAREEGGGPRSERIYREEQFGPALDALKDEVGNRARLYEVSLRADRLEFQVRVGGDEKVYVGDDGNYDDLEEDPRAIITGNSTFSIRRVDASAPQRIVEKIERREPGDEDFRTTQLRLMRDGGELGWTVHGRVGQRGVGYYATPNGRRVITAAERFSP